MEKKYELTDETICCIGHTLHRIKALKDFFDIKKGDIGGFIEKEGNLSQDDDCWVYDNAKVFDGAKVFGNAIVFGYVTVSDNARVFDYAQVFGDAEVYGSAHISGNAKVYDDAKVYGNAEIKSEKDYITFKNNWSSYRWFTWTKSNNMWKVGCFYGTGEELIKKAYKDSEESGKCYEIIVKATEKIQEINNGRK